MKKIVAIATAVTAFYCIGILLNNVIVEFVYAQEQIPLNSDNGAIFAFATIAGAAGVIAKAIHDLVMKK